MNGLRYESPVRPIEVIGAGRGATVLTNATGQLPGTAVLVLGGGAAHRVSGLTLRTTGGSQAALALAAPAEATGVAAEVTGPGSVAFLADGATFSSGSIAGSDPAGSAVTLLGSAAIRDSVVTSGGVGVRFQGAAQAGAAPVRIERSRIVAAQGVVGRFGDLEITDSLLRVIGTGGVGINLSPAVTGAVTAAARRLTIAGDGSAGQRGVDLEVNGAALSGSVALSDSILTGLEIPTRRVADLGGNADMSLRYVNGPAAGSIDQNDNLGTGATTEQNTTDAPVAFVNAAGGDYRLAPGSPLIDAGDPAAVLAGVTDLAGTARPLDGDGDGTARLDLGALESPVSAPAPAPGGGPTVTPPVRIDTAPPRLTGVRLLRRVAGAKVVASVRVGEAATVTARLQRRLAGRWVNVGGAVRRTSTGAATLRFTLARAPLAGAYRLRATARDRAGNLGGLTAGFAVRRPAR